MGRYAQLVIGPAGSGKSTYCYNVQQHCETVGRTVHVVNLDPAAEQFEYPLSLDVRDLVTLEDVMEELQLGPNGGLMHCMEYLEENLDEWLGEELEGYGEEDYLVIDCPGQIELYSHMDTFRSLAEWLKTQGWAVCVVYCLDCQFVAEVPKFVAGCMQALSAMVLLELPHINVLTKVDLLGEENKKALERYLFPEARMLVTELDTSTGPGFRRLNGAVAALVEFRTTRVDDWSMLSFVALDYSDEESVGYALAQADHSIQFGEDAEVRVREFDEPEDAGQEHSNGSAAMDDL